MTKKQRKRLKSSADLLANSIKHANEFPIRYASYQDAENNTNPIKRGELGYDSAPYEQRFLPIKS